MLRSHKPKSPAFIFGSSLLIIDDDFTGWNFTPSTATRPSSSGIVMSYRIKGNSISIISLLLIADLHSSSTIAQSRGTCQVIQTAVKLGFPMQQFAGLTSSFARAVERKNVRPLRVSHRRASADATPAV